MLFPFAAGNMAEHVNVISSSVYPVHDVDRLVSEPLFIPSTALPDSITTLVGGVLAYEIITVTAKKDFAGITTEIPVLVNEVLSGNPVCFDISTGLLEFSPANTKRPRISPRPPPYDAINASNPAA